MKYYSETNFLLHLETLPPHFHSGCWIAVVSIQAALSVFFVSYATVTSTVWHPPFLIFQLHKDILAVFYLCHTSRWMRALETKEQISNPAHHIDHSLDCHHCTLLQGTHIFFILLNMLSDQFLPFPASSFQLVI